MTVEYGLRNPDGRVWPVPAWVPQHGLSPLDWARGVAESEGKTVVARTVTVTAWADEQTPRSAEERSS